MAETGGSLFQRRIEFHPARKPFYGFSNGGINFNIETLNRGVNCGSSGGGGSSSSMVVKKVDDVFEFGFDPELNFGITIRRIGAGLSNMGNTCFLNSVLQCLTHTEPFAAYLQSGKHKSSCHKAGFCALCAIQNHVKNALQLSGRTVAPKELVKNLRCISRNFRISRQEDAHEYMVNLLESMHKCCLPSGVPTESPSAYEKSLVHKIFGGCLRSQVKCTQCSYCSNTFDPFLDLSLEIAKTDSVRKALQNFTGSELLDGGEKHYHCERCMQKVKAQKQLTVHKAPYVLSLHLKRFSAHNPGHKIDKKIAFDSHLDMKSFVSGSYDGDLKYTLYGVLVHIGSNTHSGHYLCFVRMSSGMWHKLDDNQVVPVGEQQVLSQKAYMLFYVRDRRSLIPRRPSEVACVGSVNPISIKNRQTNSITREIPNGCSLSKGINTGSVYERTRVLSGIGEELKLKEGLIQRSKESDTTSKVTLVQVMKPLQSGGTLVQLKEPAPVGVTLVQVKQPVTSEVTSIQVKEQPFTLEGTSAQQKDSVLMPSPDNATSLQSLSNSSVEASSSIMTKSALKLSSETPSSNQLILECLIQPSLRDLELCSLSSVSTDSAKNNLNLLVSVKEIGVLDTVPCDLVPEEVAKKELSSSVHESTRELSYTTESEPKAEKYSSTKLTSGPSTENNQNEILLGGNIPMKELGEKITETNFTKNVHLMEASDQDRLLKPKKRLMKSSVGVFPFNSKILFRKSLSIHKKKKMNKNKRLHKERNASTKDDLQPSTSRKATTDFPDLSHSRRKKDKSSRKRRRDCHVTEKLRCSGESGMKIIEEDINGKKSSTNNLEGALSESAIIKTTELLPPPPLESASLTTATKLKDATKPDSSKELSKAEKKRDLFKLLTRGSQALVPRWDGMHQALGSSSDQDLKIGHVLDEWDEELDRGKKRKIRNKVEFGGPNVFREIAMERSKMNKNRFDPLGTKRIKH